MTLSANEVGAPVAVGDGKLSDAAAALAVLGYGPAEIKRRAQGCGRSTADSRRDNQGGAEEHDEVR